MRGELVAFRVVLRNDTVGEVRTARHHTRTPLRAAQQNQQGVVGGVPKGNLSRRQRADVRLVKAISPHGTSSCSARKAKMSNKQVVQ